MFQNREEAGRLLLEKMREVGVLGEAGDKRGVVLAIPRGGVVVGKAIAKELGWPLDILLVKKIGAPGQPELAIGAVAEREVKVVDWEMALRLGVGKVWLDKEVRRLKLEVREKAKKYRTYRSYKTYTTYILTDDGVATGATMEAAIKAVKSKMKRAYREKSETIGRRESIKTNDRYKKLTTQKLILAIPVGAREMVEKLGKMVDEAVVLEKPFWFSAVGQFYREFREVSDEEVVGILREINKNF